VHAEATGRQLQKRLNVATLNLSSRRHLFEFFFHKA
jgi:hypothetical protein